MDLNSGNLNSTTMIAQWTPSFYTITYMQEMTDLICSTVQTPVSTAATSVTIDTYPTYGLSTSYVPETTLTDSRDNETYRIRKLSDGNCWMTENLRLGNSSNQITITASDSNTNGDFVLPVAQTATTGYWSNASNSTNTKKIYQNSNTSYGNYYNWHTATAGSGTASITAANTDVSYSICAKGWRLPTDRNIAKSYYKLGLAYNSSYTYGMNKNNTRLLSFPLNFVISGGYNYSGQKVDWQEVYGLYWTSTNYNGTIAYDMDLSYSYTYFHDTGTTDKAYGWTIRCVNI